MDKHSRSLSVMVLPRSDPPITMEAITLATDYFPGSREIMGVDRDYVSVVLEGIPNKEQVREIRKIAPSAHFSSVTGGYTRIPIIVEIPKQGYDSGRYVLARTEDNQPHLLRGDIEEVDRRFPFGLRMIDHGRFTFGGEDIVLVPDNPYNDRDSRKEIVKQINGLDGDKDEVPLIRVVGS